MLRVYKRCRCVHVELVARGVNVQQYPRLSVFLVSPGYKDNDHVRVGRAVTEDATAKMQRCMMVKPDRSGLLRRTGKETGFDIAMLILAFMNALAIAVPPPDFVKDVRPILEHNCFGCHGSEKEKSGYRLDVREIALRGGDSGEAAIVPHDATNSPLIRYVSGDDEDMLMPPKKSGKPRLTRAEVDTLRAWIDAGPAWPEELAGASGDAKRHWSLRPLVKPSVPAGHANPIDAFIRTKLALNKLAPAPAADRRTLIRRLYYNLIGLPPTPKEVNAFVSDHATTAYDSLVTRLLASPRHGEHWARHWLDVAHYADTHGNDHDYVRPNAWPYRDYVISAFNDDKPYARFIKEQVAGDALFPDDPQATVALGFLAAGPWDETLMVGVREDTVDHRFSQVLDRDDMVTTVMSTFTALTVHCARCHNHKFDPISQREYYALQAVFAGVDRADRSYDLNAATHVRRRELVARKTAIARRDATVIASLGTPETRHIIDLFINNYENRSKLWQPLEIVSVTSASGVATDFARQKDGSWFVSGERPEKDTFIVTAQVKAKDIRASGSRRCRTIVFQAKGQAVMTRRATFILRNSAPMPNRQAARRKARQGLTFRGQPPTTATVAIQYQTRLMDNPIHSGAFIHVMASRTKLCLS